MEAHPDGEFDAWVAQHVPAARHAQLRDAADSLADLRCCDIDDLDDALGLLQWPDPERRRFLEAWRALGAEASVPSGAAAVDNPAANAPAIDPAVYARSPFRRGQLVLVPAAAFGDDYASEHPQTLPGSLVSITNVERDEAGGERRLWNVSYADYAWETDESWFLESAPEAASEEVDALVARNAPIERTEKPRGGRGRPATIEAATTVRDYFSRGGKTQDLQYDLKHGFFRVRTAPDAPPEAAAAPSAAPGVGDRVRVPGGRAGTVTASEGWAVFVEVDGAGEEAFREDQLAPVAAVAAPPPAPPPPAAPSRRLGTYRKGCEVRRVGDASWRRFASQKDAGDKFPGIGRNEICALVGESRDGQLRQAANGVRGIYEARDYDGDDFEEPEAPPSPPPAVAPEHALLRAPAPAVEAATPDTTGDAALAHRLALGLRDGGRSPAPVPAARLARGDSVEARWGGRWYPGVIDNVMEGGYEIVWDEDGSANEILARDVRPSKTASSRAAAPKPRGARPAVPKPRGRPRTNAAAAAPRPPPAASGPTLAVGDRVALLLDDVEGDVTKCSLKGGWYEVVLETGTTANFRKGELRLVRRGTKRPAARADDAPAAQRPRVDYDYVIEASSSERHDGAIERTIIPLVDEDDDAPDAPPPAPPAAAPPPAAVEATPGSPAVAPADAPPPPPPAAVEATPPSRPKDIAAFLAALELPQYAGGFVANGVDFLAIPALERDDWVELGVPIGHRARIIKEHKALHPEMW